MQTNKYLYSFGYDDTEMELSKLESKYIFNKEQENKLLFSDIKIEPSRSAFIKRRLDIVSSSSDYEALIKLINKENIKTEGFKVEYLILAGDTTGYKERLNKLKDVGFAIETYPDYHNPTIVYGICYYESIWYFGIMIKNTFAWHKHKQKPRSFSNSIGIKIAKALVNIATRANKEITLLDACCGVGTIMLEACYAGNHIEGCDINWKISRNARENIAHFNYTAEVHLSDIKDLSKRYDAAILDLPYNLYSSATDNDIVRIIESTAKTSDRLVIVSTSDIASLIHNVGFNIVDQCDVSKRGKSSFARRIWVCEINR